MDLLRLRANLKGLLRALVVIMSSKLDNVMQAVLGLETVD